MSLLQICDSLDDLGLEQISTTIEQQCKVSPLRDCMVRVLAVLLGELFEGDGKPIPAACAVSMQSDQVLSLAQRGEILKLFLEVCCHKECPYTFLVEEEAGLTESCAKIPLEKLEFVLCQISIEIVYLLISWFLTEIQCSRVCGFQKFGATEKESMGETDKVEMAQLLQQPPNQVSLNTHISIALTRCLALLTGQRVFKPYSVTHAVETLLPLLIALKLQSPASFFNISELYNGKFNADARMQEIVSHQNQEYSSRKTMLLQRLHMTLQNFLWYVKDDQNTLQSLIAFINEKVSWMPVSSNVTLTDQIYVSANIVHRSKTSNLVHTAATKNKVHHQIIGPVQDRGGRTNIEQTKAKQFVQKKQRK